MTYSKIPLAQTVVGLCKMHNVKHIVISPGSRNAPLTISFTHDSFFTCYSIVDERCAAFFALGIAQQLQAPVAVVCTSGSALLNYYPAVSEAYYSAIPLVVISADRPAHLVGIGDGQTVKQENVYGEHVLYSANLKLDLIENTNSEADKKASTLNAQKVVQSYNETKINQALKTAATAFGPIHINVPFNEPLYERVNDFSVNLNPVKFENQLEKIDAIEIENCLNTWQKAKRKLILVGVLQPNSVEEKWLKMLANDDSVIVFTETTSNLHQPDFFPGIDKMIAPLDTADLEALQPDILLTFGGLIVSKKIKVFLRNYKPQTHWHINLHTANDTFFCLEKHIKLTPNAFFEALLPQVKHVAKSDYKSKFLGIRQKRRKRHDLYLQTLPFSDFTVFNSLLKSIPKQSQLQVGNSSAIRYTQLFQLRNDITVFCNRGTSGIDGSTSTAIGAAVVSKKRTTFVTGDLSFFYDSNALWNNYIPNNFRIIVVNNEGGGIFRILPGHKNTDNFDTYFETKHKLTAKQLCDMFSFEYHAAKNQEDFENALESFYDPSNQPKLMEVFTPSRSNDEVLLEYLKFLK